MSIDTILERIRESPARHTIGGACEASELDALERRLGGRLPDAYREFIQKMGAGIFYERHEILGPRRVMLHDIEFVPDIFSVRRVLESSGKTPPPGTFPVHRDRQSVHYLEIAETPGQGRVLAPDGAEYSDFATFLESVVLPE